MPIETYAEGGMPDEAGTRPTRQPHDRVAARSRGHVQSPTQQEGDDGAPRQNGSGSVQARADMVELYSGPDSGNRG